MGLGEDLGPVYYNSRLTARNPTATIEKPEDAARVFFDFLKTQIEDYVQQHKLPSIIHYSVSVPASFESNQRTSLLSALTSAGIKLDGKLLIDEPNAAFLSYLAESNLNGLGSLNIPESSPLQILVFDWGAGTLDISILEIARSDLGGLTCKNLAISKFTALGGDDIDKRIVTDILLPQLFKQNNCNFDDFRSADLNKRISLKALGVRQLRDFCKNRKIKGYAAIYNQRGIDGLVEFLLQQQIYARDIEQQVKHLEISA